MAELRYQDKDGDIFIKIYTTIEAAKEWAEREGWEIISIREIKQRALPRCLCPGGHRQEGKTPKRLKGGRLYERFREVTS